MNRLYLIQRVLQRKQPRRSDFPGIDDMYQMDYMGSAEFEFGALPKSLKRICKNLENFIKFTSDIKDCEGNNLQFFIEKEKFEEYISEVNLYLKGKNRLKEHIHLQDFITGLGWDKKPIIKDNPYHEKIWWDIDNDVWFTFLPNEIEKIKTCIENVKAKKKLENVEGWF